MKQNKKNKNIKQNLWKTLGGNLLIWVLIIVMAVTALQFFSTDYKLQPISYTQFQEYLESDMVESGKIVGRTFKGKFKEPITIESQGLAEPKQYTNFTTVLPEVTFEMTKIWDEKGIIYRFEEETTGLLDYLIQLSPWLLIIFFWFFLMRKMQGVGGQNGIFNFAKSRAKIISPDSPKTTFKDVAGCDEAKVELQEIVEFLKSPDKFKKLGAKIPHGALLLGSPGTGKTLLARAVSGEANVPFFCISGAEFVEMFVGVGASRVRDLFDQAKRNSPSIIFIDEIDAVGRHRGAGLGGGHDEREQTLNQILVEMDGFDTNTNVIVIAATNRPDILDPALLRPGRFDRRVTIDNPDLQGRTDILVVHSKGKPIEKQVEMGTIARQTPGFSGADLANLINESAILAARRNGKTIVLSDLTEAIDRVSMGPARKSKVITDKEKKLVAFHEAGHAVVSHFIPDGKNIGKVTIVSRGHAGGFTRYEQEDQSLVTKTELEAMIASSMGGREAEFLIEGVLTTGAANDFEQATKIAREVVMRYGMATGFAYRTYGKRQTTIFLGKEHNEEQDYSNETAVKIDNEIDNLLKVGQETAKKVLTKNRDKLELVAKYLLKYETLDADQFKDIMEGNEVKTVIEKPKPIQLNPEKKKVPKTKQGKGFPEPQSS